MLDNRSSSRSGGRADACSDNRTDARIVRGVNDWSVCASWADRDLQISDEDRRRRARQFMPFAALKGFYDLVEQAEQENEARFRDVFADRDDFGA